jgi:AGZA family xanthine/uracil permease-like MFS transporter
MICQLVGLYVPDAESGYNSLFPTMSLTDFSKLGETFGQLLKPQYLFLLIDELSLVYL